MQIKNSIEHEWPRQSKKNIARQLTLQYINTYYKNKTWAHDIFTG